MDHSEAKNLRVEVLSTGDEVLLGDIVDTNSSFICEALRSLGLCAQRISAVGDDGDQIARILKSIASRSDVGLVTGGLGPTQDDVTARACAAALGETLEPNEAALASMAVYFKRRGYPMTPENEKQALLPSSARILENSWGTAPGFCVTLEGCDFYFMPGVPSEMKPMMERLVVPKLRKQLGLVSDIPIARFTVFGLHESRVGALLKGFDEKFPGIRLGFRADFPTIEVKLVALNNDDLTPARAWVAEQLGSKVVSTQGRSLAAEVGHLLSLRGESLAVAESCTGGLIAHWLTDVPGSSDYFLFSGVTYANEAKEGVLGVKHQTLVENGAVHETTALEMARGTRKIAGAHWGISTTGIAGPTGGSEEKPVGTVCIGISGPGEDDGAKRYTFSLGDRHRHKLIFAAMALEVLRRRLVTDSVGGERDGL